MTGADFRRLALEIPGATESSHGNHPDFRIQGKVFATLGYPDDDHGMVKLTPEQQRGFQESDPEAFAPSTGAWGRRGATHVLLASGRIGSVRKALQAASTNVLSKKRAR